GRGLAAGGHRPAPRGRSAGVGGTETRTCAPRRPGQRLAPGGEHAMKITDVRITGLAGGTGKGGRAGGLKPGRHINTILEVLTDEGLVGIGSAMTSKTLVEAALALLRPMLLGERADEPARVSEKLRQSTFWQGRGGAVEHAISGLDIALWDLMGKV